MLYRESKHHITSLRKPVCKKNFIIWRVVAVLQIYVTDKEGTHLVEHYLGRRKIFFSQRTGTLLEQLSSKKENISQAKKKMNTTQRTT